MLPRHSFLSSTLIIGVMYIGCLAAARAGSVYTFTHLAGSTRGPGANGGENDLVRFKSPNGVAVDGAGNVYVVDSLECVVRRITPAGVVTTVAGVAGESGSADGMPAVARLQSPHDLTIDAAGNLYTLDNYTVRKISPAGEITTVAGQAGADGNADGVGSAALFGYCRGITIDSAGNLYVADFESNAVRKISPTGAVSSYPAAWSAATRMEIGLSGPNGVAIGEDGELLVLRNAGLELGTFKDNGAFARLDGVSPGFSSMFSVAQGLSVDRSGNIYVANTGDHTICKVSPTGVVTVLAGTAGQNGYADGVGGAARFSFPTAIAVDSNGVVYVADGGNDLVRKISPDGEVTTITGGLPAEPGYVDATGDAARFDYPTHVAVDAAGNLYVSDYTNDAVRKVAPNGAVSTVIAAPQIRQPGGLAVDDAGNVFVADSSGRRILKVTPGGEVSTFSGSGDFYSDGTGDGLAAYAVFGRLEALCRAPSGNFYVVDSNRIRRIDPNGTVTTLAGLKEEARIVDGQGSAARFFDPLGIAAVDDDTILVSDGSVLRRINAAGEVTTIAGNLSQLGVVDGIGASARFKSPRGLTVDAAGNVYIAEGVSVIRQMTRGGLVTTIAGAAADYGVADGTETEVRFNGPFGIAVDAHGNLYVADAGNYAIRKGVLNTLLPGEAPRSATAVAGGVFTASISGLGAGPFTYAWQFNGSAMPGQTGAMLSLSNVQPANAGLYRGVVNSGSVSVASEPSILAITTDAKVIGLGAEVGDDIHHSNGNIYDQVLLEGSAATITADPGQVTRISYIDLDDDIVQVEFSGAGSLTLTLQDATSPAPPLNYNQSTVSYVKGHAAIVIAGADASTNVSIFSVGRANAVNQALFKEGVNYDGIADIAYIAILSTDGKFGGVRTANANYFSTKGRTGLYAPGVEFVGPVYIGNITAFDEAEPVMIIGAAPSVSVTGGDLFQANGGAVKVRGVSRLLFSAGTTSHGDILPAQTNKARLEQEGVDVTNEIVAEP